MTGFSHHGIRRWLVGRMLALLFPLLVSMPASAASADDAVFKLTYPKQRLDAPAFQVSDLDGNSVSLDRYRNKVVLVHFWATFCIPCLEEMPVLESLWQEYGEDGLVILGIAGDRGNTEIVREFAERTGVSFPVVHDPGGEVRNRYEVVALPTSYLVGRDGKISGRAVGPRAWDAPGGRGIIEKLLGGKQTQ